VTCV